MTVGRTPGWSELVAAVRREGQGVVAAAGLGLDAPVPTCGDWDLRRLCLHLGRVYHRAAGLVADRATADPGPPPAPAGDVDPVAYLADALDEVVAAFDSTSADTPVWNWSDGAQTALWWARRMAHESAVHRFDAQRAHGVAQPVDDELARDGVDEFVDVILRRIYADGIDAGPRGVVALSTADGDGWRLRFDDAGVERVAAAGRAADVRVAGPSSALLLACYGRVPWTSLEVDGDASLLTAWSKALLV